MLRRIVVLYLSSPHPYSALSVDAKLKFGKLKEILLLATVHCSDLFVLRKSSDRERHPSQECSVCGGPTISPAILNISLFKVPCTQRINQLICGPLTARRALYGTEISDRRQGHRGAIGS